MVNIRSRTDPVVTEYTKCLALITDSFASRLTLAFLAQALRCKCFSSFAWPRVRQFLTIPFSICARLSRNFQLYFSIYLPYSLIVLIQIPVFPNKQSVAFLMAICGKGHRNLETPFLFLWASTKSPNCSFEFFPVTYMNPVSIWPFFSTRRTQSTKNFSIFLQWVTEKFEFIWNHFYDFASIDLKIEVFLISMKKSWTINEVCQSPHYFLLVNTGLSFEVTFPYIFIVWTLFRNFKTTYEDQWKTELNSQFDFIRNFHEMHPDYFLIPKILNI